MDAKFKIAEINNMKLIALRPLAPETLKSLRDYYRVGLTFSSNALEGNSLTESETKVVIEDGLTIDGNGRLARLLMNLALLRNEYSIALIPAILRHEYISTLELAHSDDTSFKTFIADRIIATQMDLLRLLTNNGGVNPLNGGVNDELSTQNGGVNQLENQLMEIIQATPGLNAPAIAITLQKSLRTIQRYLKKLSDEAKIEFKGAAKNGGYYILIEE